MIFVMGLFVAAYGILAAQRIRSEESEQRVDVLLATKTTRNKLMGSHVIFSVVGTVLITIAIGLGIIFGKVMSGDYQEVTGRLFQHHSINFQLFG